MIDETGMTVEKAAALRAPFPRETIGQLPKPYSKDSSKGNCPECHGYHGLPAAHLDYVGHAAVTDRLLQVDPAWTWEPVAVDPQTGAPLMVSGGLWIRLTVCGVSRLGWGDGKSVKECIGDAIRNAAMRFGVALDLWAKESLVEGQHDAASPGVAKPDPAAHEARELRLQIASLAQEQSWDLGVLSQEFTQTYGISTSQAGPDDLRAYLTSLQERIETKVADTLGAAEPDSTTPPGQPPAPADPSPQSLIHHGAKTAAEFADAINAAETKAEVRRLLRDAAMAGLADEEVGDAQGEPMTLNTLATRRMGVLPR